MAKNKTGGGKDWGARRKRGTLGYQARLKPVITWSPVKVYYRETE